MKLIIPEVGNSWAWGGKVLNCGQAGVQVVESIDDIYIKWVGGQNAHKNNFIDGIINYGWKFKE